MKAATCFLVVSLLAAGLAQAATTSRLTGTVVDTDDAPLPGVTVQLWSEVLIGGRQTAVADAEGRVAFNLLPPGPYSLSAELPGFVPVELEARVALDAETQVGITMVAQEFEGTIEVTAEAPLVDVSQVGGGESYHREYLRNAAVGIEGRDWLNTVLMSPGATSIFGASPRNVMPGKNPNFNGSLQSENSYLIDWLNVTDPQTSTFYAWLNHDAIQEISELSVGLDAEYGYALGGVINLVTRSGGNTFSGSLDVRYRDESFNESGEHFDPDENVSSLRSITAVLGGPVLVDRLWFFASYGQRLEEETPTGSEVTRESDRQDWLAKLTWQASGSTRAIFKASGYPVDDRYFNAGDPAYEWYDLGAGTGLVSEGTYFSENIAPEAHGHLESTNRVLQAEVHAVLTDALLLSVQAGINRGELDLTGMAGDLNQPAYYNRHTRRWFGNSPYYEFSDRDSDHYRATLSWFVDQAAGRHELKAGVEHRRLESSTVGPRGAGFWDHTTSLDTLWPGDGLHIVYEPDNVYQPDNPDPWWCTSCADIDGDGFVDGALFVPGREAYQPRHGSSRLWGGFVQDTWRPLGGLTVQAGVRYDEAEHRSHGIRSTVDLDDWQPRLGVAWDPFGNGEQVVRASWARSMHPASTELPSRGGIHAVPERVYLGYEFWCGDPQTLYCDREWLAENRALDGQEHVTVDEEGNEHYWYLWADQPNTGLEFYTEVQGGLDAPRAETWSVAAESQLGPETSLEVGYVSKKTRDLIEDTSACNTWLWDSSAPQPSLDDPDTWTSTDCEGFVLANVPQARRDYEAWTATFETRYRALDLKMSYRHSRSRGGSHSEAWVGYSSTFFDTYPQNFHNVYGATADDRRHRIKLSGWATLPWDLTASFGYSWASGAPIDAYSYCGAFDEEALEEAGYDSDLASYCIYSGPLIYLEPRGSRRGRANYNLDLGLAKAIRFSDVTFEVNLAVLNVWGDERPKEYNEFEFREDGVAVGEPTKWTEPRRYQLGVRVEF